MSARLVVLLWLLAGTHDGLGVGAKLLSLESSTERRVTRGSGQRSVSWDEFPLTFESIYSEPLPSRSGFQSQGNGFGVLVEATGWVLSLESPVFDHAAISDRGRGKESGLRNPDQVIAGRLIGANPTAPATVGSALPTRIHRFIGDERLSSGESNPVYSSVKFMGIYPGIDAVYYGNGRELEYDFVVGPGVDPRQIQHRYEGIEELRLNVLGDLELVSGGRTMVQRRPVVYQQDQGKRVVVDAEYELLDASAGIVTFKFGKFDTKKELIIDPVLSYAAYLGGNGTDRAWSVALDAVGNAYVVGDTQSTDLTRFSGSMLGMFAGGNAVGGDAFVAKIRADGSGMEWLSYLGGNGQDKAFSVALAPDGSVVVAGSTGSTNFPVTTNSAQSVISGKPELKSGIYQPDGFVAKLDASGSRLIFASYLGGSEDDEALAVTVDTIGAVYVTGQTASTNFPVVGSTSSFLGGDEVFVTKFSSDGTRFHYSLVVGGDSVDSGEGIAVDAGGKVWVTGLTSSTNFPVVSPLQFSNNGVFDAFLMRLSPDGSKPEFSTYWGGNSSDYGIRVQLDRSGRPVLVGQTFSTDLPITNAVQTGFGGGSDAFFARFNSEGSAVEISSYLGGRGVDQGWDLAIGSNNDIHLVGATSSEDFPLVEALQTNLFGFQDSFVATVGGSTNVLTFSSFFGGADNDEGLGIAIGSGGAIVLVGRTFSMDDLATSTNVFQHSFGGGGVDSFVARILPTPRLRVQASGAGVQLIWPRTTPNFGLEVSSTLDGGGASWVPWSGEAQARDGQNVVTLIGSTGPKFFRLAKVR